MLPHQPRHLLRWLSFNVRPMPRVVSEPSEWSENEWTCFEAYSKTLNFFSRTSRIAGRFPHCRVERADGYASCAHCGRWLKHIVWVEGVPYGSTCYAKAVRAFEQAREAQLEVRRAARHAKARQEVQPPPQPEQPASDKPRTFRDEAGREFRYDQGHRVYLDGDSPQA